MDRTSMAASNVKRSLTMTSGILAVFLAVACFAAPAGAAAYTQSGGTASLSGQAFTASNTDQSGVYVTNGGTFTLTDSTVTTTGNTSSSDNSSFLGLNAGVLAYNATINLTNCTINTSGEGANGVFAYGSGVVHITGGNVTCTGRLGHAVMASGGGTLTVDNLAMSTAGKNSGAIATDRGGGTLTVTGGSAVTSGADSPGIYSTGTITVTGATISAINSEGAVIEGKNNVVLTNTSISGGINNYGGVLIMQSMSGDSSIGTANFTINGGSLTASTGSLFFVTNTDTVITLAGVNTSVTSGTLLTACGTARWGTTGSNGGDVTLICNGQTLSGNLVLDAISTLSATLQDASAFTGAIDAANTSKSVLVAMDDTSTWTVTADSHVTSLSDGSAISGTAVSNIVGNGHNVYYDASAAGSSYLASKIYSLVNGGKLLPEGTAVNQVLLTVNVEGRGSVVPAEGEHYYDESTVVSLSATPEWGWHFVEWQGHVTGTDNPLTVTMSEDKSITAVFEGDADLPVTGRLGLAVLGAFVMLAYCFCGRDRQTRMVSRS